MKRTWIVYAAGAAFCLGLTACPSADIGSEGATTGTGGASGTFDGPGSGGGPSIGPGTPGGFQGNIGETGPGKGELSCPAMPPSSFGLSSDDSNSMGSPGYAREMLNAGRAPDPALIRTYEFLNYYDMGYTPSADGGLSIIAGMYKQPGPVDLYSLQVAVVAPPPDPGRAPMTLTIVVDTSQSMAGTGMATARSVVREVAGSLKMGDTISLVTLDQDAPPLVDGLVVNSSVETDAIKEVAASLTAGGGSDLQGGLVHGYALAHEYLSVTGMNRVMLITDGRANPKKVDQTFIGEAAKQGDDDGIYLVGVGTGPAEGYNDALLNQFTDYGRGAYVYIDSDAEAHSIFSDRFSEVMDIAARSVSVELSIPWFLFVQQYHGEYIAPADAPAPTPQHLAPGDAMVFNLDVGVNAPTCIDPSAQISVHVEWQEPRTLDPRHNDASISMGDLSAADPTPIRKANAVVAYAEALKTLDQKRLSSAAQVVHDAFIATGDKDLQDIEALILKHPAKPDQPK